LQCESAIASAIVAAAQGGGNWPRIRPFSLIRGKGIFGVVEGKRVALSTLSLFEELKISADPLRERAEQLRAEGQTVMFVAIEKQLA